ncbi:MAG: hypothetical protein ACLP1Q_10965 [Solirubrobacteraceae bacterium]
MAMRSRRARERSRLTAPARRPLTIAEIAWLLSVPCAAVAVAAVAVAAMLLLGAPLGSLLLSSHGQQAFLPEWRFALFPKSAERARYLIGLAAPVLLAMATLALSRRPPRLTPRVAGALVKASQYAGAAFIVVCVWIQRTLVFGEVNGYPVTEFPHGVKLSYFTTRTLLVALVLAAVVAFAVKSDRVRRRVAGALGGPHRGLAIAAVLLAVLATVIWVIAGVNLSDTLGNAAPATVGNVKWPLDETFAVLDGRSPLVNFTSQYGSLWPYLIALVMSVLGTTFTVFSVTACTITAVSLLATFATLRRVAGSAIFALVLYLPFLANGFFAMEKGLVNRFGALTLYSVFPLRYAGPYLLAWIVTRHLDGARPRHRWIVFLVGGLVILNNVDFGVPAFGATLAAILWIDTPPRPAGVLRLLGDVLAGLLSAYALVSVLTLLRTGSLPELGVLFLFARLYGLAGFGDLPTPALGFHIVIYLTYVAAIGLGTVRAIRGDRGRLLTGLLVWSGVFGLGIGDYYMGRSSPEALPSMFSAWTLALALLTLAAVRGIARDPQRRLTVAHAGVFLGLGVAACSLAQTPAPWTQVARLSRTAAPVDVASPALKRILIRYGGGRPEAIMNVLGPRVAYESGIVNVSPYLGTLSVLTTQQLDATLHALTAAGGRLLVLPLANTFNDVYLAACEAGFSFIRSFEVDFEQEAGKPSGFSLWSAPVPGVAPRPCPVQ